MYMPVSQPLLWGILFYSALIGRLQSARFPEQGKPSTSSPAILANLVKGTVQVCHPPVMFEGGSSSEYIKYTSLELDLQDGY